MGLKQNKTHLNPNPKKKNFVFLIFCSFYPQRQFSHSLSLSLSSVPRQRFCFITNQSNTCMQRRFSPCSPFTASMWSPPPSLTPSKTQLSQYPPMSTCPNLLQFVVAPLTLSPSAMMFSPSHRLTSVALIILVKALRVIWMLSLNSLRLLVNF